jgi:predicted RNA binding protein YcfA (HicA-like mRNA interferase family)
MKFKEAQRLLLQNGFELKRVNGSHYIYGNGTNTFTLPHSGSREMHKKLGKQLFSAISGALLVNGRRVG